MRILYLALLAGLIPAAQALAGAIGDLKCADAEAAGRITHQDYEQIPSSPGTISANVLLIIDFDVRRVRFGSIRKGPMRIEAIAPERLNDGRDIALYLHRRKDKSWWIADCLNR